MEHQPKKLHSLYIQWCKETKRNGSVLIGSSIREFFEWVDGGRKEEITEQDENVGLQNLAMPILESCVIGNDHVEFCYDCEQRATHVFWWSKKAFPHYFCDQHLQIHLKICNEAGVKPIVNKHPSFTEH